MNVLTIIRNEIQGYINGTVNVRGVSFSTHNTIKKIERFSNNQYATGNIDSQGNYKYWYDVIASSINNEVKNIDFDTKDIVIESEGKNDDLRVLIANLFLRKWMNERKEGIRINEIIEESSGWGNVLLKKCSDDDYYEKLDLTQTYIINQLARSVQGESPDSQVIERHVLTRGDLQKKKSVWDTNAVENLLNNKAEKGFLAEVNSGSLVNIEVDYFEIFERNGEISLADLKEAQGKPRKEGDENEYVLAKICAYVGTSDDKSSILFADILKEMPYKEYHRGKYEGRWLRKGLYEILFDIQVRANEIGNQIARALEFSGHQIFYSKDELVFENILSDLKRGDIIKTEGLNRVDFGAHDISNYISEWNNLMNLRDKLSNSSEIIEGNTPAGTPFKLGNLLNVNAGKFYDFIREKLSMTLETVYADFVLPSLMKKFKAEDVVKVTGDTDMMQRYWEMRVDAWYLSNLDKFPPHDSTTAETIKENAMEKIMKNKEEQLKIEKGFWEEFKPRARVVITGEGSTLLSDLETLSTFIGLETDPVRRTALIEMAMKRKGVDVASLPKTEVQSQPLNNNNKPNGQLVTQTA